MIKIPYANMGVNISVSTSTMQTPAPKLSKVHFDISNLKNKNWSDGAAGGPCFRVCTCKTLCSAPHQIC